MVSVLKEIRKYCIECLGGMRNEVEKCSAPKCRLYPFRMGRKPKKNKVLEAPQEERQEISPILSTIIQEA